MISRTLWLAAGLAFALVGSGQVAAQSPVQAVRDKAALAVLERTKTVRTQYALYAWNWIYRPDGSVAEEWSAEFNSGNLHRVETPSHRLIADCAEQTGTAFVVATGETISGPQVAAAACGINTNAEILRAEFVGRVSTRFGDGDRVRIEDADNMREYDVSADGVLLGTTYSEAHGEKRVLLRVTPTVLEREIPDPSMFDSQSLSRSFVGEEHRLF